MHLIGPFLASFALTLLAIVALRPVAIALKWIDRPGGRKSHVGDVPVIGGLAMFLGMVLGLSILPLPGSLTGSLLAASVILVTVGLIDDRFTLSPWTRLPVQVAATVVVMLGTETVVETLGAPVGPAEIRLAGFASYAFTILITVAAINAFNMLDGLDGLAGALALVALVALAVMASGGKLVVAYSAAIVLIGVVGAFLVSNVPIGLNRELRCFMGDSGSTLLGFCVAWLCIDTTQGMVNAARPVTIGWIVAIPLFDLFWTVLRRTIGGISPFKPDHGHLHHLLLKAGFSERGVFVVLVTLSVVLAAVGIAFDRLGVPDSTSFFLLVGTGVLVVRFIYRTERVSRLVPGFLAAQVRAESAAAGAPRAAAKQGRQTRAR